MWERTYRAWKGRGVQVVGIGLLASKKDCAEFVRRHGLTFPNGYDGAGRVAKMYRFTYQPYWAVVARNGTLVKTGFGPADEEELVSTIRSIAGR